MDKRVKYWESNYVNYWQDRVSDHSQNKLAKKDVVPPDVKIFKKYYKISLKYLNKDSNQVLDVGIGFGRFVSLYKERFINNIWGSDISQGMVDECKKNYPEISKQIKTAPAETQPFKDSSMDLLICWATFDATYQEQSLLEFQRLLKDGGIALISGKNDNYMKNDNKAMAAEIGARKKKHPNYFTDVNFLEKHIFDFGFELKRIFKFKRRGDFAQDLCALGRPKKFYEYVVVLKKNKNVRNQNNVSKIASKFSKVWEQTNKEVKK